MFLRTLVFLAMGASAYGQSATFQWIRQLGGTEGQTVAGMATDPQGNIYVAGSTSSVDFPTKSAIQAHPGGSGLYRIDGPASQFQSLYNSGLAAVSLLTVDPRTPNTLYAIGDQGLSRTTDGGATWGTLGGFSGPPTAVVVDPSTGALYVSTSTSGVFESTDGGATWNTVNNGIGPSFDGTLNVYALWIDPRQPSVLYASTYPGLARSTDGGASWQANTQLGQYGEVLDLAFDPNTPGLLYAATLSNLEKSIDNGVTWTALPNPAPVFGPKAVLLDPKHSGTLYAAGLYAGVWASTDGGNTWTNLSPKVLTNVFRLAADPVTGALYALVNGNLFMSTDGFQTTAPVGPVGVGINCMVVSSSHVFAGAQAGSDVYVVKFDPQGNVVFSTYFGGLGAESAGGMAVDAGGSVYVTGTTTSVDFPVSPGAYATSGRNFVFKLNPDGSLGYSTYFAPAGTAANAIAVDGVGHAFITGYSEANLPVTAGAYQPTLQGSNPCCNIIGPGPPPVSNAFLTEFDTAGASLIFSTYVGTQTAFATKLVLTPDGNAVLSGYRALYRVKGDGSALLNSNTSFPGTIFSLAVDGAGNLYAGGQAFTTSPPFPTTTGVFQTTVASAPLLPGTMGNYGDGDGFVVRLDSQFNILTSTLIGGEAPDETVAVAIAPNGDVLAGGYTNSKLFPTLGAAQGSFSSASGFLTEFTPDLSSLVFSTYVGDSHTFVVSAMVPTADGGVLFAGSTAFGPSNVGGPFGPPGPPAPQNGFQGYLVKTAMAPSAPRIDRTVNAASQVGVALSPGASFQVQGDGFGSDAILLLNGSALPLVAQSRTALTAMLPADFSAPGAATIVVQSGGSQSSPFLAPVATAAPGVFSVDGSGVGQGYILNQDGTLNSPANPASEGAPITIYATGVGPLTINGGYAVTASPVNVDIDGFYADGIAASQGPVAGLPGQVYQISVYVPRPSDLAASNPYYKNFAMPPTVAVNLEVNGARSQAGLALSVKN